MPHTHQIHVVPQDGDFAGFLDAQSQQGWEFVTFSPAVARRSALDTQAVPAFVCVFRKAAGTETPTPPTNGILLES